jgi:hypothetical protein
LWKNVLMLIVLVFILGWLTNDVYSEINPKINFQKLNIFKITHNNDNILTPSNDINQKNKASPQDWIKKEQIEVYNDKIIIKIENPEWSSFADTKSMDPVLDSTAHGIHIIPKKPEDIQIGDIVAYESNLAKGTIIHRVIGIDSDKDGLYYILKGDNNNVQDPEKVRFSQIRRVLVAIIY